jgi:hypothetical protein
MSIALDASTPVRFTGTPADGVAIVQGSSFIAPSGAFLALTVGWDTSTGNLSTDAVLTVTDDSGDGVSWTAQVLRAGSEATSGGASGIYTKRASSAVARKISISRNTFGSSNRISAVCYVFTLVDVNGTPVDAITADNEGGSAANPTTTTILTPGANGALVAVCTDWNALTMTSADLKGIDGVAGSSHAEYAGAITVIDGWKPCTIGVGVTADLDPAAGTPQLKWCDLILREAMGDLVVFAGEPITGSSPIEGGLR